MKKSIIQILLLLIPFLLFGQWNQLGSPIQGEASGDDFGYTTSMDDSGNVIIAGSFQNSDNGYFAGHAKVYEWDGANWVQRGDDIDGNSDEWSGYEVTINGNGNRVAIGAIQGENSTSGLAAGIVRVYDWDGTSWNQKGSTLEGIGSPLGSDWFGSAISFNADGSILAIGARNNDNNGGKAGQVRIFQWDGNDWIQLGNDILGDESFDELGGAVSLNDEGNILAIGAVGNGSTGFGTNLTGYVKVYEWSGTDWEQRGDQLDGVTSGDDFGHSVSLNATGDILAIGAPGYDVVTGNLENTTHVYEWSNNNWVPMGAVLMGDEDSDLFGSSVNLNAAGNILAIGGAPFLSDGNVWIYEWTGTMWEQQGNNLTGEATSDFFGTNVNLNAAGNRLAVGAWGSEDFGQVYIFENTSIVNTAHIELIDVHVFPNPVIDYVYITASERIESIRLYDISGKEIMVKKGITKVMPLSLDPWRAGTYFLIL